MVSWLCFLLLYKTRVLDKEHLAELVWIREINFQVEETFDDGAIAVFPKSWHELGQVELLEDGSILMHLMDSVVEVWHLDLDPFLSHLLSRILHGEHKL